MIIVIVMMGTAQSHTVTGPYGKKYESDIPLHGGEEKARMLVVVIGTYFVLSYGGTHHRTNCISTALVHTNLAIGRQVNVLIKRSGAKIISEPS